MEEKQADVTELMSSRAETEYETEEELNRGVTRKCDQEVLRQGGDKEEKLGLIKREWQREHKHQEKKAESAFAGVHTLEN